MTDDAIGNYLDTLKEREFDAPFMTLLRAHGFWDVHFTHGQAEFGKDFIAKREEEGVLCQFAFQSKPGNIATNEWRKVRSQIDLLRTSSLSHPAFDSNLPRRAILVITGRLTGNAPIEAQEYRQHLEKLGELQFTLWDKETIVEMMSRSPETGLSGKAEGKLFGLIGKIDENEIQAHEIERFSRRWFAEKQCLPVLWKSAIEAAVIANRLRQRDRLDLACLASLCLVRAAWGCSHAFEPPDKISLSVADSGRGLFRFYAETIWQNCEENDLDPLQFIRAHESGSALGSAFVNYPIRCLKIIETLGLLGLLRLDTGEEDVDSLSHYLAQFLENHPGAAHPISDKWAVSLIPPVLFLAKTGRAHSIKPFLQNVTRWISDHYESNMFGLAGPYSEPEEEINYFLGPPFEHVNLERRHSSYTSTVVLDLAAILEMGDLFDDARNEFLAVGAHPSVIEMEDTEDQYVLQGANLSQVDNVEFAEKWSPIEEWKIAPHHFRMPQTYYLQRINRTWDLLAISCVLRDRHFLVACRNILHKL